MASIDINLHGIGSDISGGGGSSSDFLQNILRKLDTTIEKLNSNIQKSATNIEKNNLAGQSAGAPINRVANEFGSTMGTALAVAVGGSILRGFNNQANAIMNRASNAGGFMASAIQGNATQNFGSYASRYVGIEAQRVIANNNAIAEGVGGLAGATVGAIGAGALALADPAAAFAIKKAAIGGGATGFGVGDYAAAKYYNQFIQQQSMVQAAEVERKANETSSQWRVGFGRFGLDMSNQQILSAAFTGKNPIMAPMALAFEQRYGSSQNFNAIQNNIAPYLPAGTNLLSHSTGLDRVAQNFLKAGFAVSDFSKLTLQSSQYQAITGKNIKSFSEDLVKARYKFGDAYDVNSNQTALNLMQFGIGSNQAQHLANQAIYNPGVLNSVSAYANSSFSDYYRQQAIGNQLGIDLPRSLLTGHFIEKRKGAIANLTKSYFGYMQGNAPTTDMALMQSVLSNPQVFSLLQKQVAEGKDPTSKQLAAMTNGALAPGQAAAYNSGTLGGLMQDVSNMTVNATGQVTIIAQNDIAHNIANTVASAGHSLNATQIMQGNTLINTAAAYSPGKKY